MSEITEAIIITQISLFLILVVFITFTKLQKPSRDGNANPGNTQENPDPVIRYLFRAIGELNRKEQAYSELKQAYDDLFEEKDRLTRRLSRCMDELPTAKRRDIEDSWPPSQGSVSPK